MNTCYNESSNSLNLGDIWPWTSNYRSGRICSPLRHSFIIIIFLPSIAYDPAGFQKLLLKINIIIINAASNVWAILRNSRWWLFYRLYYCWGASCSFKAMCGRLMSTSARASTSSLASRPNCSCQHRNIWYAVSRCPLSRKSYCTASRSPSDKPSWRPSDLQSLPMSRDTRCRMFVSTSRSTTDTLQQIISFDRRRISDICFLCLLWQKFQG